MNENTIQPIETPALIQELADGVGGTITECAALPDGSGFATMSFPLPKTHWLYADDGAYEAPPMSLRDAWVHADGPYREMMRRALAEKVRAAGRYAVRAATMNGKEIDFDPDALVQNLVVGMLGYFTADGLSGDEWANPTNLRGNSAKSVDAVDPQVTSTGTPTTRDKSSLSNSGAGTEQTAPAEPPCGWLVKCPTCGSFDPLAHPLTGRDDSEVRICPHRWHREATDGRSSAPAPQETTTKGADDR